MLHMYRVLQLCSIATAMGIDVFVSFVLNVPRCIATYCISAYFMHALFQCAMHLNNIPAIIAIHSAVGNDGKQN